jgi:hypothetical protein
MTSGFLTHPISVTIIAENGKRFGTIVGVAFQIIFHAEIYTNNVFLYF